MVMSVTVARLIGGLVLLCVWALPAHSAPPLDPQVALQSLDTDLETLRTRSWNMHGYSGLIGADDRGRQMADDIRDKILTPSIRHAIASQRQRIDDALDNGKQAQALTLIDEVQALVSAQNQQLQTLSAYWRAIQSLQTHEALYRQLHQRYSVLKTRITDPNILVLRQQLRSATLANEDNEVMRLSLLLVRAYNQDRSEAINQLADEETLEPRQSPCGPARTIDKDQDQPTFDRTTIEMASFYPPLMRQAFVEGSVILNLLVNEQGCVTARGIGHTSGVAELDDAALGWAEQIAFYPARRQGQTVSMQIKKKLTFRQSAD